MNGMLVFVLSCTFLVLTNAQFLSMPDEFKGLIPEDIQDMLAKLTDKQRELLAKADVYHTLGSASVTIADKLLFYYEKLTPEAQEFAKYLLTTLNTITKTNARKVAKDLILGFEKLSEDSKESARKNFPRVVKGLEGAVLSNFAEL